MSMIGKTLGHYQITNQLGKGGMGEVYQAKDQKLGRDVAIKVLPNEFAKDADRVARFQREAKLLASLNHPNIAAIHGLEESGGTNFLVLELVEGQTLADRIKAGPIPVEESLKLALQIAEALEAAHEKGIIHRDLKPANIKVTPDGKVKVLDFGLAKAFAGEQEQFNLSNSPTLSDAATQQGIILGTAAYMSPEQAKGKIVDKRADIWAFGVVLFEMLTGRQVFTGETVSDTLASVLAREPAWNNLPLNLHPRIRLLLERCLEKDAKNRYSGISDARVDIQKALADPSGVLVQHATTVESRMRLRTMLPWIAAVLVLGLIIAGVGVWKFKPTEPRQVMRFEYDLPEGQQLVGAFPIAVSPDGRQFVYSTSKGLYIRSVDELTAKPIAGAEGDNRLPLFSRDGNWIGYLSIADQKLKKINLKGGAPVVLCDITAGFGGASWGKDDTITFCTASDQGIFRVSANGGTPELLIKPKSAVCVLPQILPDGKSVLYTNASSNNPTDWRIVIQSLKSGETKELFTGVTARYLPTGHILCQLANNNNLFAIPFDLERQAVAGGLVPIVEGVFSSRVGMHYAVSESGTLVYVPGASSGTDTSKRTLVWVDRTGKEEALHTPPDSYMTPKISPDGKRVALAKQTDGTDQIWIWDLVRETMTRLTFDNWRNLIPIWTQDGNRIVFTSIRNGKYGIYSKAADGTGDVEKLGSAPDVNLLPFSWSSDGKTLAIEEMASSLIHVDIGTLSLEGDHARKLLLHEEYSQGLPNISPDGKYMAYFSNESGRYEVYMRPFPEVNKGKWQISTGGGESPLWSPDGRELFYRNGGAVMAVPVDTNPDYS